MTYGGASNQGAIETLWLHFWGSLTWTIVISYCAVSTFNPDFGPLNLTWKSNCLETKVSMSD